MKALITGFTGTLGTLVTKILLEDGHQVVGYSRDELKQSQFLKHERLTCYLGDVRNGDRLVEASRGCDIIYHFAALKQVDKLEENPEEAIETNVKGTQNALHAQRINKIPRLVLSSTDKAVYPINVYGNSKAMAERLVLRNPNNVVTRYGNVLGSRGSVIPKFIESIKKERAAYVTDRRMTRYWITPQNAALFVFNSSIKKVGGLSIPAMRAYPVIKIASVVADTLGAGYVRVIESGIRPGEKIHENLRTDFEGGEMISSDQSNWFSEKEIKGIVANEITNNRI